MQLRRILVLLLVALAFVDMARSQEESPAADEPVTKWTSIKGQSVEGEFVSLSETAVTIRLKADGKEVEVPLKSLSIQSHFDAIRLGHPENFSKPVVRANAAPELGDLNVPVLDWQSLMTSPFGTNPTIDQYMDILKQETERGNFFVGWHSIPPKMQADLATLVSKGYEKVGPEFIGQIHGIVRDVKTIVTEKGDFVFGSTVVAGEPMMKEGLTKVWPALGALATALANDEIWAAENFHTDKIPEWMAKTAATVGPASKSMAEAALSLAPFPMSGDPFSFQYTIVSQTADSAVVEISAGSAPPQRKTMQKLGNIWISVEDMNQLRENVDAGLKHLDGADSTAVPAAAKMMAFSIASAFGALARAESQEEFNEAATTLEEGLKALAETAQSQIQASMGPAAGAQPGNQPPPGRGGNGGGIPGRPGRPSGS
ncbi:MAG: hypothetical protein KDB03_26245 [Planctomycetales bacterium]|nr:hypothetical protein [Planctomycetales bacterium]